MSMVKKIESISDTVRVVLMVIPETRDNDKLLMVHVWYRQNERLSDTTFRKFAVDFVEGRYADTESIRRSRQKLQELYPELRGEKYKARQEEEEPDMRENMPRMEL